MHKFLNWIYQITVTVFISKFSKNKLSIGTFQVMEILILKLRQQYKLIYKVSKALKNGWKFLLIS